MSAAPSDSNTALKYNRFKDFPLMEIFVFDIRKMLCLRIVFVLQFLKRFPSNDFSIFFKYKWVYPTELR